MVRRGGDRARWNPNPNPSPNPNPTPSPNPNPTPTPNHQVEIARDGVSVMRAVAQDPTRNPTYGLIGSEAEHEAGPLEVCEALGAEPQP